MVPLDLGLPDNDGLSLARELRRASRIPIIVVSARGREEDKILALDMGADDCITKPFGSGELLARIRVSLRHAADLSAPAPMVVEVGSLRMDFVSREVTLEHKAVRLTKHEFDVLAVLIRHAGQVAPPQRIGHRLSAETRAGQPVRITNQIERLKQGKNTIREFNQF